MGRQVEAYLNSGRLAPDDLVNEIVADLFRRPDRPTEFVMDGYPRTLPQAVWFETVLRQAGLDLEYVVQFDVPEEELVRRLGGRRIAEVPGRRHGGNGPQAARGVSSRASRPLVDHYRREGLLREVDATADVETVYQTIVRLCGG